MTEKNIKNIEKSLTSTTVHNWNMEVDSHSGAWLWQNPEYDTLIYGTFGFDDNFDDMIFEVHDLNTDGITYHEYPVEKISSILEFTKIYLEKLEKIITTITSND